MAVLYGGHKLRHRDGQFAVRILNAMLGKYKVIAELLTERTPV